MKIPKAIIYIILTTTAALLAGFFTSDFRFDSSQANAAKVILNYGGSQRTFTGEVKQDMSLLEAIYAASLAGFPFRYVLEDNKVTILSIADKINDVANQTWHVYLNRQLLNTASIHTILIKPKDTIELRYEEH